MTPGTKRQARKSLKRFPHLQANDEYLSFEIPARFAGKHEMAKTVDPGAPKTCISNQPSKAAMVNRMRAHRIPFRPGVRYSN
jgi:hypothetical protein